MRLGTLIFVTGGTERLEFLFMFCKVSTDSALKFIWETQLPNSTMFCSKSCRTQSGLSHGVCAMGI